MTRILTALIVGLALMLAAGAVTASAVVPPKDCGNLRIKGKRYNIKADQIRCGTAKRYATDFLRSKRKPSGYRCRTYGSNTALAFRCDKGKRVVFAIKR